MTIPIQIPVAPFVANGITTLFPFAFLVQLSGDLIVKVDGVTQVIGTNYSISGLGVEAGGSVTFVTPPANGARVLLYRAIALQRTTDYQVNGDLPEDVLDADFDRLWMAIQEQASGALVAPNILRAPPGETLTEFPAAAERALKFAAFDAGGNPIAATGTTVTGSPISALGETLISRATAALMRGDLGGTTVGQGVFTATTEKVARENVLQIEHRNYIDNPGGPAGIVYQRSVAAVSDDNYFADRWYSLSQTGSVTPSTLSAPETGFAQGFRVTQSQASAQRYGFAQILPNDYVRELVSGNASLSFRARISNTTTLRWALLGWSGTADAVTSDVVNDWTSATFTTGNFFITGAGSLSVIATSSQAMTAATFATLATNAAAIGASINNLILFCWTDSTQAQNTTLDWHDVRLTKSDVRVPVVTRSRAEELALCTRRCTPSEIALGVAWSTTQMDVVFNFKEEMAAPPNFTLLSSGVNLRVTGSTSNIAITATQITSNTKSALVQITRTSGTWVAGNTVAVTEQGIALFSCDL